MLGRLTATGEYVASNPTTNKGAEIVAGVAYEGVTTGGSGGQIVAILAPAAVKEDLLVFPSGATSAQIVAAKTALRNLGIRVRAA